MTRREMQHYQKVRSERKQRKQVTCLPFFVMVDNTKRYISKYVAFRLAAQGFSKPIYHAETLIIIN